MKAALFRLAPYLINTEIILPFSLSTLNWFWLWVTEDCIKNVTFPIWGWATSNCHGFWHEIYLVQLFKPIQLISNYNRFIKVTIFVFGCFDQDRHDNHVLI